jgi:hypothetical protein
MSRNALPAVSNLARPVRSILRRFKPRIQIRDEFVEQIEVAANEPVESGGCRCEKFFEFMDLQSSPRTNRISKSNRRTS